jgi:hypothetical protein
MWTVDRTEKWRIVGIDPKICFLYRRRPEKFIRQVLGEVQVPRTTNSFCFFVQSAFIRRLRPKNKPYRQTFAIDMLHWINTDLAFYPSIVFCDESTSHMWGNVTRVRLGKSSSHLSRVGPSQSKVDLLRGFMKHGLSVTGDRCLHMVQ